MCEHSARKSAIIMAKQWIIELWLYVVARYPEFTSYCFIKIIGQLMVISKISLHAKFYSILFYSILNRKSTKKKV